MGQQTIHLKLLQPCNKGMKMNCWESLYIQIYSQHNRLLTEQLANDINPVHEQTYLPRALQNTPWQGFTQERTPDTYTDG
jgi:hypothetical protein